MIREKRYCELDALRGLAALDVVFTHFHDLVFGHANKSLLSHFQLAILYLSGPLYAGGAAVSLFFVLSGFVLYLPFLEGRSQRYLPFALRRIIRIYFPYLAALAIAIGGNFVFHGRIPQGVWASAPWSETPKLKQILEQVLVLTTSPVVPVNVVFWTLVIEIRVSLVFPLLARTVDRMTLRMSGLFALSATLGSALLGVRFPDSDPVRTLRYGCFFVLGMVVARGRLQVAGWYKERGRLSRVSILIPSCVFFGYGMGLHVARSLADLVVVVGAIVIVIAAIDEGSWRVLLNSAIPQALGKISYSLYLIHIPVLFACFAMLRAHVSLPWVAAIYVPCSLVAGQIFFALVESPSLQLSRRVGTSFQT